MTVRGVQCTVFYEISPVVRWWWLYEGREALPNGPGWLGGGSGSVVFPWCYRMVGSLRGPIRTLAFRWHALRPSSMLVGRYVPTPAQAQQPQGRWVQAPLTKCGAFKDADLTNENSSATFKV